MANSSPFMPGAKVHYGVTVHFALCGSGWLNSSHDIESVTCEHCLAAVEEIRRPVQDTLTVVEHEVAQVYCHFTGGKLSKCNTDHTQVISVIEDEYSGWLSPSEAETLRAEIDRLNAINTELLRRYDQLEAMVERRVSELEAQLTPIPFSEREPEDDQNILLLARGEWQICEYDQMIFRGHAAIVSEFSWLPLPPTLGLLKGATT